MDEINLTPEQEQVLRDQVITDEQPGPILRDFQVILDFVGDKGVEAGGKHHLLPMKLIGELDRRLSRPLNLQLKRPQIRSHPYLQGLNLLLRASGLSRVEGSGSKARLVLDPEMRVRWEQLNPTEQYFHLLEAWLRFGRPEMVGERGSYWGDQLLFCLQAWRSLQKHARRFDVSKPYDVYLAGIGQDFYVLALMDLFGFVTVKRPSPPVTPWRPAGVALTPFGDALFTRLAAAEFEASPERDDEEDDDQPEGEVSILSMMDYFDDEDEDEGEGGNGDGDGGDAEDAEQAVGEWDDLRFGEWQPLFQPYFPEWRESLELPEPEVRDGVFVFRVSLGKVWRLIAMPDDATLDDLVDMILHSMKFDSDHLYEFSMRNRLGAEVRVGHPMMNEGPWADEVAIGSVPLEPGQSMDLLYDFGDSWHFNVTLERIDPPDARIKKRPRILESHGKAPEQYPHWDE